MQIAAVRCGHYARHVSTAFVISAIRGPRSMSFLQLSTAPPPPPVELTPRQEARLIAAARARRRPRRPPILLNPPVDGLVSTNPEATIESIPPRNMPPATVVKKPTRELTSFDNAKSTTVFRPPDPMDSDSEYYRPAQDSHGLSPRDTARQYQRVFNTETLRILRHTARNLGYQIVPDAFMRVSDIMRDRFYRDIDFKTFARFCDSDPRDSFEIAMLPDLIEGNLVDIPWIRARADHTIPHVDRRSHRILNMGKLQVVVYVCRVEEWEHTLQHGIIEGPMHCIRMYRSLAGNLFKDLSIPPTTKLVCITVDAERAAQLGVMFFATFDNKLLAVGNRDKIVPPEAFRNAIMLDVTKRDLLTT